MAGEQDFEFQLRAQQEFKVTQQPQQAYAGASSGTYVDPSDGTVYEWDHQRKGWFPKVRRPLPTNCRVLCEARTLS